MTRWKDPERLERQIVETLENQKKTAAYAKSMMDIFQSQGFSRQEAFFFLMADRVGSLIDIMVGHVMIEPDDDDDDKDGEEIR
jgi:hypothetical protein